MIRNRLSRGLYPDVHPVLKYVLVCSLIMCNAAPGIAADGPAATAAANLKASRESGASNEERIDFNGEYVKGYGADFAGIITSPARWNAADWAAAILVSGAAAGLYENDAKIRTWAQDHKTATTTDIGDAVTSIGFGPLTAPLIGGMYLYGHAANDGKMRETALFAVESFALTGVMVLTLKYSFHRHRPYADDGPNAWDGPGLNGSSTTASFPSAHASSSFSIAAVIASEYDNDIVPPLAYGIAAITALNRISRDVHWASDVFVGSAIGYFTGKAVVAAHRSGTERLSLAPALINGRDAGLTLTYNY
jgi:membrane-associated phospholipid phosphatase